MNAFFRLSLSCAALLAGWASFAAQPPESRTPVPALPKPSVTLHVAADGADANSGAADAPFATLERARDEIRARRAAGALASGGAEVVVHGGLYPVRGAFTLGAEDTATEAAPVLYRAADGAAPVFSGGVRLSGFTPVADPEALARIPEEARALAVQCDLKPLGVAPMPPLVLGGVGSGNGFVSHPVPELFFNGEALPMARYPNGGMLRVADIAVPADHTMHGLSGTKTGRILYEDERHARWAAEPDAFLYGYWFFDWADSYERVAAIDPVRREITLAEPWHGYGYRKGARYYAVNLLCEMDAPGEWWLDRANAVLYLFPPSDPSAADLTLSLLPGPLLQMDGVAHTRFEGLTWELGAMDAVRVTNSTRCLFAGCTVRHCGGDGVVVRGGAEIGVVSCDIYSMGRGGVVLNGGDRKTLEPSGHFLENCHIHHLSRLDHTYTPAALVNGAGTRIAHNLMHHINSSAMRVNGNNHTVEYNEVHDVLLESDDQGGADMWGDPTYRGNAYRFNYWHHIGNWRRTGEDLDCGQAGIRLDDAISGVLIYGNIFYRCSAGRHGFGGVQIHGGKDNLIENNIFADCEQAVSFSPWGEKRWREFTAKALESPNIDPALYLERYPDLARMDENVDGNTLRRNIVWKCGKFLHHNPKNTALEDNILDPPDTVFAGPGAGDFTLSPESPEPAAAGFQPIPLGMIGLHADAYRKNVPEGQIRAARSRVN
ncbi:MAG: right-handed parallel beta-helix repeat-containing protein [Candidatus Hydrogenedens sp.]|nr:right-handed parallel beta-helix repeat-containing protein [Candidatus Hydrogenedentota bacterium]NLF59086.1 right-handed parallel beta-helix repeat-containing protein [Candidatus Hydrogenedens sp.]